MLIETIYAATSIVDKGKETATQSQSALFEFITFLWDRIDNWISALIIVFFSIYFAKFFRKIVIDKISNQVDDNHEDVIVLAGRATYVGILSVGSTIGLKVAGIDITAIIAAVGFGIGFALQDLIMNFIAGILILLNHPFKLNDFILVNDTTGKVVDIQSRCTVLQGLDGTRIVVPNSDLINKQIISYTSNPFRRIEIPVGVDYSTDLKKAISICMAILQTHPMINKEPKSSVVIDSFGDSAINLFVRFWVDTTSNWLGTKAEVIEQIKSAFDKAGISIPFPIRTVYMQQQELRAQSSVLSTQVEKPKEASMPVTNNNDIEVEIQKENVNQVQELHIDEVKPIADNLQQTNNTQNLIKQDFVVPPVEQHQDISGSAFLEEMNKK